MDQAKVLLASEELAEVEGPVADSIGLSIQPQNTGPGREINRIPI